MQNNNNQDGEPPKKKRKRTWTENTDFVDIITKLGNQYDASLFVCIQYTTKGLVCDTCNSDKTLKGWFTTHKPCVNFNYTKIRDHVINSDKHYKRMDKDVQCKHPKCKTSKANQEQQRTSENSPSPSLLSEFDQIINAIKLIHLNIKILLPDNKIKPISDFIHNNCNGAIANKLSSTWHTNEIFDAMNVYQIQCDDIALLGPNKNGKIALAFDGVSQRQRTLKIFFGKGWQKGPVTKYVQAMNGKKNVLDIDVDLSDLFTIDTGDDIVRLIRKVVENRLKINWNQIVQLAVDGAANNMGVNKGCVTTCRDCYNRLIEIEWGMTHKFNLLAKNGWKDFQWIQDHFDVVEKTYTVFSYKIMSQLYEGMCVVEKHKYSRVKKIVDHRFNCALFPIQNINKNLGVLLKTLKYVAKHKKDCKDYYADLFKYDHDQGPKPIKPDVIFLLDYWDNPSHILWNHIIELILLNCEQYGNLVGSTNRDIVSNYDALNDFELKITSFATSELADFKDIGDEKDEHIYSLSDDEDICINNNNAHNSNNSEQSPKTQKTQKTQRNAMKIFVANIRSHNGIIQLNNISCCSWKYQYNLIAVEYQKIMKRLSQAIAAQIPRYFNPNKRILMRNIKYIFDPKQFSLYNSMNDCAAHGTNELESVVKYFKRKEFKTGESIRRIEWKELNVVKMKFEYTVLRKLLFQNQHIYSDDLSLRLKCILLKIEQKPNVFPMTKLLLQKIMCLFSGIIDVERCNGIKKWICNARREAMKTKKLDKILRIYYNSPDIDAVDILNKWVIEVAKIWNRKNRDHTCLKLDALSGKIVDIDSDDDD
eukprot:439356_1